jgi:hypothetical protein
MDDIWNMKRRKSGTFRVPHGDERAMRSLALMKQARVDFTHEGDPQFIGYAKVWFRDQKEAPLAVKKYAHDYQAWYGFPPGRLDGISFKILRAGQKGRYKGRSTVQYCGSYTIYDEYGYANNIDVSGKVYIDESLPTDKRQLQDFLYDIIDEDIGYQIDDMLRDGKI